MKPRLIIEQKLTAIVNKYRILTATAEGAADQLVGLAQQKRFAMKEKVMVYSDETRDKLAFTFRAEKVLDVHGRYFVEDTNGKLLGMFKKDFTASLLNSTWKLLDANGNELYVVRESNQALALMRRFGVVIPLIGDLVESIVVFLRYHFVITDVATNQEVGTYQKMTLVRDHYRLSTDDPAWQRVDWRVWAAMSIALDALQSR